MILAQIDLICKCCVLTETEYLHTHYINKGFRPNLVIGSDYTTSYTCEVKSIDSDTIKPGACSNMELTAIIPENISNQFISGFTFNLNEGKDTLARCEITHINSKELFNWKI